jgi:hypothetical protein
MLSPHVRRALDCSHHLPALLRPLPMAPTTRSARVSLGAVQAAALVRFDSSLNEEVVLSPAASVVLPFSMPAGAGVPRTRASKRKAAGTPPPSGDDEDTTAAAKRAKRAPAPRDASPSKSILRPAAFEMQTRGLAPPRVPLVPSDDDAAPATPLRTRAGGAYLTAFGASRTRTSGALTRSARLRRVSCASLLRSREAGC